MRAGQLRAPLGFVVGLLTSSAVAGEGVAESAPRSGPAAELGVFQVNGVGPWGQVTWELRRRLVGILEGRAGLGLGYTFNEEPNATTFEYPRRDVENVDEQRILMVPLDLGIELRFARPFGLTLGGTLGLADNAARSTYCGTRTYLTAYAGLKAGVAFHFGRNDAYILGAEVMNATLPQMRCTNSGLDPVTGSSGFPAWFIDRDTEPVGAGLRLGMTW